MIDDPVYLARMDTLIEKMEGVAPQSFCYGDAVVCESGAWAGGYMPKRIIVMETCATRCAVGWMGLFCFDREEAAKDPNGEFDLYKFLAAHLGLYGAEVTSIWFANDRAEASDRKDAVIQVLRGIRNTVQKEAST